MDLNFNWIKYLSPFFGLLFCPITILVLWATWSSPIVETDSELVEEIMP